MGNYCQIDTNYDSLTERYVNFFTINDIAK